MSEIRMCDQKDAATGASCGRPAALSYRWDWGETGACCQEHGLLMQQTAQNLSSHDLKRHVSLAPLENAAEAPLERSERTALIAAKLSAEAETEELKRRGGQLYSQNVDLTGQVQVLTLRLREAEAQRAEALAKIGRLEEKLQQRDLDLGTVTDELDRLQTLAAFAPDTTVTGGKAKKAEKAEKGETSKGG